MRLKKISNNSNDNSMIGLFTIVKGQYRKVAPTIVCKCDGEVRHIGGFNPDNPSAKEWYQLMDKINYKTICCSSDLSRILKFLQRIIVINNNNKEVYLSSHKSDVDYEDETGKKSKRVTTSRVTRDIYEGVVEHWGDYFHNQIIKAENEALKQLKDIVPDSPKPVKKAVKSLKPKKSTPISKKDEDKPNKDHTESKEYTENEELPFVSEYETIKEDGKRKTVTTRKKINKPKESQPKPQTKPKKDYSNLIKFV